MNVSSSLTCDSNGNNQVTLQWTPPTNTSVVITIQAGLDYPSMLPSGVAEMKLMPRPTWAWLIILGVAN